MSPRRDRSYSRIDDVRFDGVAVVVRFGNGEEVRLTSGQAFGEPADAVDWSTLAREDSHISVEAASGVAELPWDAIRALTDGSFAAEMASEAEDHARRIGVRIRALREARGLSSKDVAERAGITPQSMSRIEHGRHDVVFTTLQRILAAMGYRLRDLALSEDSPQSEDGEDGAPSDPPDNPTAAEVVSPRVETGMSRPKGAVTLESSTLRPPLDRQRPIRILHLSDLHAEARPRHDQEQLVRAVLDDIATLERTTPFDLVLFSGDIALDGTASSLNAGRELLLDPLRMLLPDRPILLTPGNHDVNRSRINSALEVGLRHQLVNRDSLLAVENDAETMEYAMRRLADWATFSEAWHSSHETRIPTGHSSFVHRLTLGGWTIGIAVLDSAWRSSGGDDRGHLLLGEQTVRAALDTIADDDLRLVLMHHPLTWLAEFDAAACRTLFETQGVFVFTGHEHTTDPGAEMSTRGAALYSRAGALYGGHNYANAYTTLELDPNRRNVRATMRRWWPARESFDVATDLHKDGVFELPWPARANAVVAQTSLPEVVAPLARIAQEQSLIAGDLALADNATVADLLITPRFWPVPNREAIDATVPEERRPKPVDAFEKLRDCRVLLVSGEHSAGVTSSLLWILEQHFRLLGTLAPAYVRADERFSLGRLDEALAAVRSRLGLDARSEAPCLLAIDDVSLGDKRAQARLGRFLSDNPSVTVILGCHEDEHVTAASVMDAHRVSHGRVFLAPFGRRQLRQLIARIAGPNSTELVQRVLNVIHGQGLARNPLNVAALVAVVTREEDLTELNESGLLQSYVTILLENPIALDPEGLAMDYRRREHFLSQFAAHLARIDGWRVPRGDAEQFALSYFDQLGWHSVSAGHLIDSLIWRRVLSQTDSGVGFRYPALLHLFAAKWALEDREFASMMFDDPVRYSDIVRHAAGLRRSDAELLRGVSVKVQTMVEAAAPGMNVKQFELIEDREGWSQIKDLDHVRQLVRPALPPPTEDELDDIYDDVADEPTRPEGARAFPVLEAKSALEAVGPPVELLASVLKSSELVADVDLKERVIRQVIQGWSLLTILLAVREDETRELRSMLTTLFGDDSTDPSETDSLVDHFSRVLVVTFMTYGLYAGVGSRHLGVVTERALNDDDFMGDAANALFATMLYAMLGFPGWPDRLATLHRRHPRHPMVGEVARRWALARYTSEALDARTRTQLESALVEMLLPTSAPRSGPGRVAQQNEIRVRLKASRRRAKWLGEETEETLELASEADGTA